LPVYSIFFIFTQSKTLKFSLGDAMDYSFSFNGKEKNNEVIEDGIVYDYGFRTFNSSLGRFFSIDPVGSEFPFWSPYHYAGNNPVLCMDFDGLQRVIRKFHYEFNNKKRTVLFISSVEKPQDYWLVSFIGLKHQSFEGKNSNSLELFKPMHCQSLLTKGGDYKIISAVHRGVKVSELLIAMLNENPDIELIVFGNHDMKVGENCYYETKDQIFCKITNKQNSEMERFALTRANKIWEVTYNFNKNVKPIAAVPSGNYEYKNIKLGNLGTENQGITIFFDFNKTKESKVDVKGKNTPRFM